MRLLSVLFLIFLNSSIVGAETLQLGTTYQATLVKCVDGDTAHFSINSEIYKTRFLYIDTPEDTNEVEPYGKEASEHACEFLKSGMIQLETDGAELFDKYDRLLAWIWVEDKLLQEELTKAGLVKDFYDYGDYHYEEQIIAAMKEAKEKKVGMYSEDSEDSQHYYFYIVIILLILFFLKRLKK